MTDATPRFALPLLQPGQAQKEMRHNEAVAAIDAIVQASVVAFAANTPPGTPAEGQSWIIGTSPTGAWASEADALATWSPGGWRFTAPVEGMAVWVAPATLVARFAGGGWTLGDVTAAMLTVAGAQVVGARRPAIADPAGGAVIDAESRAAIAAILAALRGHGLIAT